ncbi:MAG: type IV pili methyl-accepting chemotaxis transducer N-terminal domain-containing protein, partial [Nitrospirae bacterium]|nr:type IV pili methyl-accepting chemotaxis transducer N-terminal domain-containing protein [Nitrospirota bacterium]
MKTIFRSLTRKLILMGIVMVIAIGIFIAATYILTQDIKGDATRINHAGRLRYRSFEMAWLASTIIEAKDIESRAPFLAELNLDMERFDKTITDLRDGSRDLDIGPMEYEDALTSLKAISDEWHTTLRPMLSDMIKLPREKARAAQEIYNKRIEGYVYEKVDRLVSVLENASKKKLRDFNLFRLYSFGFFSIATVFVIFYARRNIIQPVRRLRDAIREVEKGNFDIQAPVAIARDSGDEVILLTHTFNDMVRALKVQIEETGMLIKGLDDKNKELLEANKALQSSKEQIEVAYEEAQTQSEELESANEELRILNEDLDRKTKELLDVNKRLKIEEETAGRIKNELQSIFDGIQDSIVLFDLDYNIVKANKAFMEGLHLQPKDLAEKKCFNLLRNRDSACDVCVVKDTYNTA